MPAAVIAALLLPLVTLAILNLLTFRAQMQRRVDRLGRLLMADDAAERRQA
jgi:hypothetical protein